MLKRFILLTITCCAFISSYAEVPTFQMHTAEIYSGPNAKLVLPDNSEAKRFQTKLEQANQGQVNFAGHYIVTSWGCGAMCKTMAIIDVKTGKVFFPASPTEGCGYKAGWWNFVNNGYQANSKLLILTAGPAPSGTSDALKTAQNAQLYYRWHDDKLKLLDKECVPAKPMQ